jgi:hypothetical protein
MSQDEMKNFLIDYILRNMQKESEELKNWGFNIDTIDKAKKCLKHIKCIGCADTSRFVRITDGFLFGVYYDEFTCGLCNNGRNDFIRRHNNLNDAVDNITGRQIPCHEDNKSLKKYNTYSHVLSLAKIYVDKYELADKALVEVERKEREINVKLIELKEREYRIKLEEARIKNELNALNSEKIPKWFAQKFDKVEREIHIINVKVDIQKLVEDIMKCVAIAAGNIASIPSLVSGLDASLNLCWSNSKTHSYYSDIVEDEKGQKIYVRFDFKKIDESHKADVKIFRFFWEDKKEYLCVSYLVLKPSNASAETKCIEMMNSDFQNILTTYQKT